MVDQVGIGLLTDEADLNRPSDKDFPVEEHFVGLGGEVFSRGIAEIEREVAADARIDGRG